MGVIDDYIASFPEPTHSRLVQVCQALREEIPEAAELISYAIPTFDLNGKHLIHFAGFKNHIGLYPTPHGITAFDAELAAYKQGKGSVQLPHDQPLPVDLIRRIAQVRRDEVLAKPRRSPRT